jgi:SAM-dependent methyltransferase
MTSRLRRMAAPPEVLVKRDSVFAAADRHHVLQGRILNVGSKNVRIGADCVNFDCIAGPQVDVVGDAHHLGRHFEKESFDVVILSAVLQYCEDPRLVLEQVAQILRPSGLVVIDVPFLQPYCPDGADLWRFSADGLRRLCEPHFTILEVSPSIAVGPATAFTLQIAASRMRNRPVAIALAWLVTLLTYPLRFLPGASLDTAGAILLVGRKRSSTAA